MPSNVILRGDSFSARVTVGGVQRWLGTYPTAEDAREAVRRARGGVLPSAVTVAEWEAQFQALYPGRRNTQTERHNAMMVAPFCRQYARRPMRSITALEAQSHAVRHAGSVRYLRMMFAKALRAGVVERNVWETVETPRGSTDPPPRRPPTLGELDALVAAALGRYGEAWADLIVFTAYSGLRLSEVADVQAGDLSGDCRRVVVRGKRHAGEEGPRVRSAVVLDPGRDAVRRQAPDVGVVWRSVQGRRLDRHIISRCFRLVCKDAGIEAEALTFHSLRKFYATFLRDAGADPRDIAMSMGHTDASGRPYPELVDRVYAHPGADAALARLEAVAG